MILKLKRKPLRIKNDILRIRQVPYDEWFDPNYKYEPHPYDNWPMAKDFENPRPEEEIADDLTMHEKMYRIATAKYNPFSIGGSESIHDFE